MSQGMDMTVTVHWSTVAALGSIAVSVVGLLSLARKSAMNEGRFRKEVETIKENQESMQKQIDIQRDCQGETTKALAAVATDMDWVKASLERIEGILQKRRSGDEAGKGPSWS